MTGSAPDWGELAPAAFLSFRDDGTVTAVNDHLLRLVGRDHEDVVGRHVEGLLGVAGRIFFQTHLFPLVRMHGHADEIYVELRSVDGDRVPVLLNVRRVEGSVGADPAEEDDASAVSHCVMIRVRERKRFEEELLAARKLAEAATEEARNANRAKSMYLQSVSHEIRTPINALLGYAELLELGVGQTLGDKQMMFIARIRRASRHLLTLVNDLLDLAKIESGAMRLDVADAVVENAVAAALAMVEPQAADGELEVIRLGTGPGPYVGDHDRVTQIVLNLLSNAVKFTRPGGRVEVDWSRTDAPGPEAGVSMDGPALRVSVTDTGVGIPAEAVEAVFEPFAQVAAEDAGKGTGLGLTISREMARLMNGDLTVRSTVGEGTTFTLWLPVARS